MAKGKVKWFSNKKGYGFITGDNGQEIFVHQTAIKSSGFRTLEQGEQVDYNIIVSDKGPKAENVQRLRL